MGDKATWSCDIGPIDRDRIPDGGDQPLREAVRKAYFSMFGEEPQVLYSGWGKRIHEESDEPGEPT